MKPTMRAIWAAISVALRAAVLALMIALVVVLAGPKLVGGTTFTVLTGSMEPTHNPGDSVVVVPVEEGEVKLGDVITFMPYPNDPTLVTHRVVKVGAGPDGAVYTTQGDANNTADKPIASKQVVGKVLIGIPKFGYLFDPLKEYQAFIAPLMLGGSIVYGIYLILSAAIPSRRKKHATRTLRTARRPRTSHKETHDLPHRAEELAGAGSH